MGIAAAASSTACPSGCSGKSYIPRHVLWYRKEFTIPSSWSGDSFWLDFEGAFRNSTTWVNGELVKNHVCGYTPFRVYLNNITSVKPGEKSVVALFIDPDNGDGGNQE